METKNVTNTEAEQRQIACEQLDAAQQALLELLGYTARGVALRIAADPHELHVLDLVARVEGHVRDAQSALTDPTWRP